MKRYIITLMLLACVCFAQAEIVFIKSSSHKGDIWTIANWVKNSTVKHGYVRTNSVGIKWNIKEGRMRVVCDDLCNDDDEFRIRMFDKDDLPLHLGAFLIKPNMYISGDEYIIPANVRKDIARMDIIQANHNWEEKYEVICDDGYTLSHGGTSCIKQK